MTRFIHEGPLWRRAVVTASAMILASAVFVVCALLVLGSVVDFVIAPAQDTKANTGAETAKDVPQSPNNSSTRQADKAQKAPGGQS